MDDTQQTEPREEVAASSTKSRKQLPRRYVLAILCNLAFFFRGLVVANIGQMAIVKNSVAGSDIYSRMTNTTILEMSNIVFSYHWVIILGQMPAAILVFKFSARKIMITSMVVSSLLQIITPWTLSKSLAGIVLDVFFQSLCLCPLDYACIGLLRKWAPSAERSRILMLSFSGRFAHYQLAYLLSFKLSTSLSPTFSYYLAGVAGAIWCILWYALIKDDCPLEYKSNSESEEKVPCKLLKAVPFKNIVMSLPFLSLCLVFASPSLSYRSLMALILFQTIANVEFLGYLSLIINTVIFIPVAGFLIDRLISKDKFKNSTIRKVICAGGLMFHVLFVMLLTIENEITAPLCFYLAFLIMDLTVAGIISNFLELSARYCVLIMGLAMTVTTVISLIFEYIAEITQDTTMFNLKDFEPNLLMYELPVLLTTVIGALLFAIFGSAEEQHWSVRPQPAIELQDAIENNSKKEITEESCTPQNV